ncbi:MAG: lipoprotein [Gammaproteobacteria bacterium]|nr:lipoprotein [Gammaproteobacteria bacterium]
MRLIQYCCLVLLAFLLNACGQTGPLYLPHAPNITHTSS